MYNQEKRTDPALSVSDYVPFNFEVQVQTHESLAYFSACDIPNNASTLWIDADSTEMVMTSYLLDSFRWSEERIIG